jgi:hypothetical protein
MLAYKILWLKGEKPFLGALTPALSGASGPSNVSIGLARSWTALHHLEGGVRTLHAGAVKANTTRRLARQYRSQNREACLA